jgi:hypothetical protein
MERGRRPTNWRLTKGLNQAAAIAGLVRPDGSPVHLTLHQLRHTFGTSLVNAGMSLPALMALMGHVTPEMTLRYARLASPAIRTAYEAAMGKVRARTALVIAAGRQTALPSRIDWLAGEMLRPASPTATAPRLVAGACPYANICEQCDNFVAAPESAPAVRPSCRRPRPQTRRSRTRWEADAARHARAPPASKNTSGDYPQRRNG